MKIPPKDLSDKRTLEKYSSAFTLSDMEIFIFPDLYYPLVLANIMSPIIWQWRDDPWFKDIEKKSFVQKTNRIKQYIIDNYVFNLDPVRVPQKYPGKKYFKGPKAGQYSSNPLGKNPGDLWVIPNVKSNHCPFA